MRRVVFLTVATVVGSVSSAYGQGSDLEQKVREQFSLTKVTADRSDITAQGTVVALRKDGLMGYSTASCVPYPNTYNEKGKIVQHFMEVVAAGLACGPNNTNYPYRRFAAGEKLSIVALFFKNGVTFDLYSDPYDGVRYYSQLTFPFKKGSILAPDEALARIAAVLESTQVAGGPPPNPPAPVGSQPVQLRLPATYVNTQTRADQLQLNSDNSFSLQEGGQPYRGNFTVNGNRLEITIADTGIKTPMTIQGNNLTDPSRQTWTLREQSSPVASSGGALRNEDVIKMAKVGIDDVTIIAKIGSSKCQFDTSTDALIQLKQSGVSAAVLKAVVGGADSPPGASSATSGAAAPVSPSGVPTPLTPADGSIFDNFPRKTTVSWTAVPGAVEYRVEVDFSSSGVWASENPDRPTPPRTYSSKTTSFSFNFVGAQPGRWRVSAIDRGGRCSEPSPWWSFRYSR